MKTLKFLILGLVLSLTFSAQAQISPQRVKINPKLTIKPPVCKDAMSVSLKGSVREPNHSITNKVKYYVKDGKFYIRALKPINENSFIWAQFPFRPGYPTGKITGMKVAYKVIPRANNSKRTCYISQERIVQGPQPFQGVVRLDDPTNLYGSGVHASTPFGPFACKNDYKTVSLKLVMQPGDLICIEGIRVLFKCPQRETAFRCPPRLPNPKIKLAGAEKSGNFVRYKIPVYNYNAYPDYMFAAAPNLPACGQNNNSSRSWIDIYNEKNQRIYGFCALGKAADMKNIWFGVQKGKPAPQRVRIVIHDRGCKKKYTSNWISIPQS